MEKKFLTPEDHQQMARYLAGEMDIREVGTFREYLQQKPHKQAAFNELEARWKALQRPTKAPDTDIAWEKLNRKLDTHSQPLHTTPTSSPALYLKWAAGWLLLIALASLAYVGLFRNPSQPELLTLQTDQDNITHVYTLHDGSIVYLANSTLLSLPHAFEKQSRSVKLEGEAFFDVAHRENQPFVIETANAIVEVLGTSFNLKTAADGNLELYVESGRVRISMRNEKSQSMTVDPGELLSLKGNTLSKTTLQGSYNTAWRKNHMHFKDEKLGNILSILNQNHQTEFALADAALGSRKLTVTFYNNSPETMAQLIALSLDIACEKQSDTGFIFKSKP